MACAPAHRQIGKPYIEPLAVGNVDIALELDAASAALFMDRNIDHMLTRRQDALHDEIVLACDRHFPAHDTHREPGRQMLAVHRHHTAMHGNAGTRQLVNAMRRQR